jgi:hypothetical protein
MTLALQQKTVVALCLEAETSHPMLLRMGCLAALQ